MNPKTRDEIAELSKRIDKVMLSEARTRNKADINAKCIMEVTKYLGINLCLVYPGLRTYWGFDEKSRPRRIWRRIVEFFA